MNTIKSMTGYATLRHTLPEGILSMDLKSLNSRYFEIFFKLPDQFRHLESPIREKIKASTSRGRFDFYLNFIPNEKQSLTLNKELVQMLCGHLAYIQKTAEGSIVNAADILNFEGVLSPDESLRTEIDKTILEQIDPLIEEFLNTRVTEGTSLKNTILEKVALVEEHLKSIQGSLNTLVKSERDRLKERIAVLQVEVPPERFEQEVAILAQKSDITEEYDRLCSHVQEVRAILQKGGVCGKRLDFMMQEFNRETNTIASKAATLELTKIAVDLKVIIEQMREQVQNIE